MSVKEYLLNLRNKLTQTQYIKLNSDEELYNLLDDTINNFFPTTGCWGANCFVKQNDTLQSNLRNNKLLAKKILNHVNLSPRYYNKVLEYINSSDLFKQKVHDYEQEIVKWQIEWIKNDGENWICDDNLGGDICLIMPQCDIAFRKGVVDTLSAIGINKDAIEEGLEKNAGMWRDLFIRRAFRIKYEPLNYNFFGYGEFNPLPSADLKHKQAWIKMRKYEYYCDHKESVDLYGSIEPDMLMTMDEVISLKNYLEEENAKRLEFINQHNKRKIKTKDKLGNY